MLLLSGHNRTCSDWWIFSVGRRILSTVYTAGYSILSVCSPRATFDHNFPIEDNLDVRWIYKSLQIWMNDIYYSKYQRYPSLYIYAVSRGSHFAGLLCRVLPVQAQILYIYPGYHEGMTARSTLDRDVHTRLTLDRSFASWFAFKYCYGTESDACLFYHDKMQSNFHPVPPTYFVHVANDAKLAQSDYTDIIQVIQKDARQLGGAVLQDEKALQLRVSFPPKPTPSYMQEHFHQWRHKPHASRLFYEHLMGFLKLPEQQNSEYKYQTFWCHRGDFTFFERYPSIMKSWSEREQEEYRDYRNDIRTYHELLTEEFCGDLSGQHAMVSLDLVQALAWLHEIDDLRQRLQLQELVSRPVRIWMYEKARLVPRNYRDHHLTANCSHNTYSNRMYMAEHIVQEHFQSPTRLGNPLLADYFLIPHDLYCFIFFHQLFVNFSNAQFKAHVSNYSRNYFEPLLNTARWQFPYWMMSDQPGANHIVVFVGGRNMGVLEDHVQMALQHVIQLGPTGIRQDLLRRHAAVLYLHRNLPVIYRHAYDVVIPPFTPTEVPTMTNTKNWYAKKTRFFFFAGALNHSFSSRSARPLLDMFARNRSGIWKIERKAFSVMKIVNGYMSGEEYANTIMASVFALCPEGYSPWTPRIYEAINLGSIPLLLADGIVLPFERFIPWRSFTLKMNVSNVDHILEHAIGNGTSGFQRRIRRKKRNAERYWHAFRWLAEGGVFQYISRELQCRRLEQAMGATSDVKSNSSREAREQTCRSYRDLCPCPEQASLAFDQYSYEY